MHARRLEAETNAIPEISKRGRKTTHIMNYMNYTHFIRKKATC